MHIWNFFRIRSLPSKSAWSTLCDSKGREWARGLTDSIVVSRAKIITAGMFVMYHLFARWVGYLFVFGPGPTRGCFRAEIETMAAWIAYKREDHISFLSHSMTICGCTVLVLTDEEPSNVCILECHRVGYKERTSYYATYLHVLNCT